MCAVVRGLSYGRSYIITPFGLCCLPIRSRLVNAGAVEDVYRGCVYWMGRSQVRNSSFRAADAAPSGVYYPFF